MKHHVVWRVGVASTDPLRMSPVAVIRSRQNGMGHGVYSGACLQARDLDPTPTFINPQINPHHISHQPFQQYYRAVIVSRTYHLRPTLPQR